MLALICSMQVKLHSLIICILIILLLFLLIHHLIKIIIMWTFNNRPRREILLLLLHLIIKWLFFNLGMLHFLLYFIIILFILQNVCFVGLLVVFKAKHIVIICHEAILASFSWFFAVFFLFGFGYGRNLLVGVLLIGVCDIFLFLLPRIRITQSPFIVIV